MKLSILLFVLTVSVVVSGCQGTSKKQSADPQPINNTVWVLLAEPPILPEEGNRFEGFQSNAVDHAVKGGLAIAALPVGLGLQLGLGIVDLLIEAEQKGRIADDLKPLTDMLTRDVMDNLVLTMLRENQGFKGRDIKVVRSVRKFNRLYSANRKKGNHQWFITPTLSIAKDYRSLQLNVSVRGKEKIDYTAFSKDLNTIFVSESIDYWRSNNLQQLRSFVSEHLRFAFLPDNRNTAMASHETLSFEIQGESVTTQGSVLGRTEVALRFKDHTGRIYSIPL